MENTTARAISIARAGAAGIWAATVWTAVALWAAVCWLTRTTWSVTKWAGRVALWVLFWPVGLWRSWRHGADRRNGEQAEAVARAMKEAS